MANEPRSELARYAYGYSDKKPGKTFWLVQAAIIVATVYLAYTHGLFSIEMTPATQMK